VGKVAGHLEASLTCNSRSVVLKQLDWRPDRNGAARIVLSPRHARYPASLLMMKAEDAEEADESLNSGITGL